MRRLSILFPLLAVCCATQPSAPVPSTPPAVTTLPTTTTAVPPAPAAEEGIGPNENLVFGHDFKFALTTPPGLVTDSELARNLRFAAIFYPPGSSWNDELALSARVLDKSATVGLAEVMAQDEAQYKDVNPGIEITDQPPIPLSTGKEARVRYFRFESNSLHEAVAYIDQPQTVALIVLRTNSDEEFKKALPLFDGLVRSYRNLMAAPGGGAD
jgi:hypothetical protein